MVGKLSLLQAIFSRGVQTEPPMDTTLRGLIWEDDAGAQRAVESVMERCGFQVVAVVASAPLAMRVAQRRRPHVIVLDLALTGELGLKVVPQLTTAAPGVAVVVLSSFNTLEGAALEAGACELLDKSDMRQLERCLQWVAHRSLTEGTATA